MIRSMTGYGRASRIIDGMSVTVEIKSLNHRFFDFSSKLPRNYDFLDEKLKNYVGGVISRGKIECRLQIEAKDEPDVVISLNHSLVKGYLKAYGELAETYGLENDVKVSDVLKTGDIFIIGKAAPDEERVWAAVESAAGEALAELTRTREREGGKTREDISARLDEIIENVEYIEARSPETVAEYTAKLAERMKALLERPDIDERRLLIEAAVFADKSAVAEETVRLKSHVSQFRSFLEADGAIGKKMDFLTQEMNREANSIGSKAQDLEIARKVVAVKAAIEKIREQVQNIE